MYLQHFGLSELPFSITPDTSYFFSSEGSQEALNTLLIAARTGEGFIKITGEVGTGKTLLCRKLMASLGPDFYVAYIPNPYLEPLALFMELGSELGLDMGQDAHPNQHLLLKAVTNKLLDLTREGKRVVVCMDEAQAMPIETLEALRLLTNLETEKRKLLQVIIFGQPELDAKLDHPSIRQLKQRITFDYHLGPLTRIEPDYYLHHRLMVAGYRGGRLFTPMALWLMQMKTKRIPRLLNIVAHKAMLSAYGKGNKSVGFFDVLAASNDTASLRGRRWFGLQGVLLLLVVGSCLTAFGWVHLL
ncbi:MAG: AAA family ATPase [Comamonadaceae bacterium]